MSEHASPQPNPSETSAVHLHMVASATSYFYQLSSRLPFCQVVHTLPTSTFPKSFTSSAQRGSHPPYPPFLLLSLRIRCRDWWPSKFSAFPGFGGKLPCVPRRVSLVFVPCYYRMGKDAVSLLSVSLPFFRNLDVNLRELWLVHLPLGSPRRLWSRAASKASPPSAPPGH